MEGARARAGRSLEYFMQYTRIKLTITNRRGIYPHSPVKAYLKPGVHFSAVTYLFIIVLNSDFTRRLTYTDVITIV